MRKALLALAGVAAIATFAPTASFAQGFEVDTPVGGVRIGEPGYHRYYRDRDRDESGIRVAATRELELGDGQGRNGTLTKNLLANINVPGLTIDDMFKRVSEGVQADSLAVVGHAQTPALYTNFTGEFCFAGCIDKVARAELEKMQESRKGPRGPRLPWGRGPRP